MTVIYKKKLKDYFQHLHNEDLLRDFINKNEVDDSFYEHLCKAVKFSEEFMREFQHELRTCWWEISLHQELSESFIRDFKDELDWSFISSKQDISEDFIREFQDRISWFSLISSKNLSEEFLIEFVDRYSIYDIEVNQNIPEDVKERIINLKKVIDQ